jgi:hypothetical protein
MRPAGQFVHDGAFDAGDNNSRNCFFLQCFTANGPGRARRRRRRRRQPRRLVSNDGHERRSAVVAQP